MTFRSKPAVKRSHRPSWESKDRRHLYLNLGLGLAAVFGVVALTGAGIASYAGAHWVAVATVNGVTINRDQYADRAKVDAFRIDQAEAQARTQQVAGRISDSEYQTRSAVFEQQRTSLSTSITSRLVDLELQGQLAAKAGISVTEAQIDQRLVDEATQKEERHLLMVSVQPEVSAGATASTATQKAAARAKADQALADLTAGKAFDVVAKAVSTDGYASTGGDVGWVLADDSSADPALMKAVFALPKGGTTGVVEGADGTFRIGRVSDIAPETVDAGWTDKINAAGIPMSAYRAAVRGDLTRDALTAKVVADVTGQPSVQRLVREIFVSSANYQGPGDEVKVRHILYTPGDKAPDAASPVPSDDPGWATAKAKAQATYDRLKALAGKPDELLTAFEATAKTDSMDTSSGSAGGELSYYSASQLDRGFADAIFKDGLKKGDLIGPIQSQYGWHVILFEDRRQAPEARINGVQLLVNAAGADFAAIAKDHSDGAEASKGGDLGWVAHFQLDSATEAAIFAAPIGKVSDILTTSSGFYLFLVRQEATRTPDSDQLTTLKADAFSNWYAAQKKQAKITQDASLTSG